MAHMKLFCACLLYVLIVSQEFYPIEGRRLKFERKGRLMSDVPVPTKLLENNTRTFLGHNNDLSGPIMPPPTRTAPAGVVVGEPQLSLATTSGLGVNDFRPTAPGHSPGIVQFFERQKGQKKSLKNEMQLSASTENLQAPATPGLPSTPSIERKSVADIFQDNFQPQRTGDSPGIGHCFTRKTGDVESQKLLSANCGTNKLTIENPEDKPGVVVGEPKLSPSSPSGRGVTASGQSPGIGHSLKN